MDGDFGIARLDRRLGTTAGTAFALGAGVIAA